MKYFTLEELTYSDTARRLGIQNIPGPEEEYHLICLIEFLDEVREHWGSAIRVNSGYRCEKLNKIIGGVPTSAHCSGWAVDLFPCNNKFEDFKRFMVDYLKDKKFDQCIIEKEGRSQWIHLGLYDYTNKQRGMVFNISKC